MFAAGHTLNAIESYFSDALERHDGAQLVALLRAVEVFPYQRLEDTRLDALLDLLMFKAGPRIGTR